MTKRKEIDEGRQGGHQDRKVAKKRKMKRPKDIKDEELDTELGINHAFSQMDPHALSNHVAQRTARFQPSLTAVELDKMQIPGV